MTAEQLSPHRDFVEMSASAPPIDVFFDPTGRRWRVVKAIAAVLVVVVTVVTSASWQAMWQLPRSSDGSPLPPINLPQHEGDVPVIGVGPLARVVRVVNSRGWLFAVDPFTGQALNQITGVDADSVGNEPYAIQHYGYSTAAHRTIELTFDDGPDPTWTPMILDLLSEYHAAATFFVVGSEVVKYPNIATRIVSEGHAIGNHTLTHPALTPDEVEQQFVSTDRIIRATTGVATNLVRLPYDSFTDNGTDINAVVVGAERLHYLVSMEEFDTDDWKYGDPATRPSAPIPLPPINEMDNITILLHDGGGNRSATVAYLRQLLPWALDHGYSFHSLPQISPQVVSGTTHITPSLPDDEVFWLYSAMWSWPNTLIWLLFVFAVVAVVSGSGVNVALALARRAQHRGRRAQPINGTTGPPVSIVLAAYNEEKVIRRTIETLLCSHYQRINEIIVVDDGSADRTADLVAEMAAADRRISLMRQENAGKAAALNRAFARAQSPIVVTLDADTLFTPTTVGNLVRHFAVDADRQLGAVAGIVKVGNQHNLLTRWQALEYIATISVDRGAQDALSAIMVVPGACAAWRRTAVLRVGGYSRTTLAEDCDLALELQQAGYRVTQDDEAICYTEVPETARALARQRFRWMYGNIQAMWKHRRMIFNPRFGWLGLLTLPLAMISVVLPALFLPFVYLMAVVTVEQQGWRPVLLYFAIFLGAQALIAITGVWLVRERPTHLLMVPIYRLIYEPLRAYVLYRSLFTILRGTRSSWNKLQRSGVVTVRAAIVKPAESAA